MQTYSKQQAFDKIKKLVDTFADNETLLQDTAEAQIEENYIRPLFSALNWNTENEGLSPANWEFVLQDTDKKGKRPDYRLQLNGQHLCLMDAKMVKYSMHDPRWQWQVYKYAYATQNNPTQHKVDFGVLTDFQEFILLDCTFEAKEQEAVNNFRVLDWRYNDYVNQFDQLWKLFERNNMLEASRDRKTGLWSCYLSPEQAKANRVAPDKGFLDKLDHEKTGWRIRLAKDMKKCCPSLTGEVITGAVQLIIDRIMFIKAISDRDIDDDYLAKLGECVEKNGLDENDRDWFIAAKPLFDRLDRFYNGSVFAPRPELEAVVTSNRVVRDIIRELDPNHSPYDLSYLPVEILGTIYERFLGNVVRTTDHQVKIEEKPEVKKAKGVYYTPSYIVDYIVEHTVGRLLADCKTPEDVEKLKILDPACGSGSFLLGAYNALIDWHKAFYATKTKPAREAAYRDANGTIRLTAKLKRKILSNNIFGVDIDQQAVEVTRFSLSLKALEDTRKDELDEERNLFKETMLPDLKSNIVCGNSLIGTDILEGRLFTPKEECKLNPMNYKDKFPNIMAQGGFDLVIGNPPWGAEFSEPELEYLRQKNKDIIVRMIDSFMYFVHQGCLKLTSRGYFGMILPDVVLYQIDNMNLRKFMLAGFNIKSLFNMGDVFVKVTRPASIIILAKPKILKNVVEIGNFSHLPKSEKASSLLDVSIKEKVQQEVLEKIPWYLFITENPSYYNIWTKVKDSPHLLLQDYVDEDGIQRGVSPDLKEAFIVDSTNMQKYKLEVKKLKKTMTGGQHVKRYYIDYPDLWVIYTDRNEDFNKLPHICHYIDQFKNQVTCVEVQQKKHPLYSLHRPRKKRIFLKEEKFVGVITEDEIIVALDSKQTFVTDGLYIFGVRKCINSKYLMAILNSKLFVFIYRLLALESGRVLAQVKPSIIKQLPIRTIDFDNKDDKVMHDRLVVLVERMLIAKKEWSTAQTEKDKTYYKDKCDAIDKQINELVYDLYGLTPEEIEIVKAVQAPR
ncbi:MAG: N-6 DNA methylase [bacterium]|nr:N-6 DNA methylase [bacterium]